MRFFPTTLSAIYRASSSLRILFPCKCKIIPLLRGGDHAPAWSGVFSENLMKESRVAAVPARSNPVFRGAKPLPQEGADREPSGSSTGAPRRRGLSRVPIPLAAGFAALLSGCAPADIREGDSPIRLQTDWYAQPEHGGQYQALAKGFYEDRGIEVNILEGGPNAMPLQTVARGRAEFGFSRSDDVIAAIERGMPLMIVAATLQRDPQALMFHADDPAESWENLDGRRVMAMPGSVWLDFLQHRYDIQLEIVSLDYGLGRFLADPEMIQQCFVSNQPFHARREGAEVDTWLIADAGYDPYHVVFAHRDYVEQNPDTVRAFVEASIEGWRDYLEGDPSPANEIILERNAEMSPDFIEYAVQIMRDGKFVTGQPERDEAIGKLDESRIEELLEQMAEIGAIEGDLTVEDVMTTEFPSD